MKKYDHWGTKKSVKIMWYFIRLSGLFVLDIVRIIKAGKSIVSLKFCAIVKSMMCEKDVSVF